MHDMCAYYRMYKKVFSINRYFYFLLMLILSTNIKVFLAAWNIDENKMLQRKFWEEIKEEVRIFDSLRIICIVNYII